jgi:hypothetical protein
MSAEYRPHLRQNGGELAFHAHSSLESGLEANAKYRLGTEENCAKEELSLRVPLLAVRSAKTRADLTWQTTHGMAEM